jgi:hypothetical protein
VNQETKWNDNWRPVYSLWRHGGWYVSTVRYLGGAVGCVSNNYPDKKWRIVCDDRRKGGLNQAGDFTFPTRDAAARAEYAIVQAQNKAQSQVPGADNLHGQPQA